LSKPKSKKRQGSKQWWRSSKNRNKVWFPLFAVLAVVAIGGFIWWLAVQGGQDGDKPITPGQSVEAFTLPDIVSGRSVSMADYLGKQPVVVVGYMGFF